MVDQSEQWEKESLRYVESHLHNAFWSPDEDTLSTIKLDSTSQILDVGCGSGQLISHLAQEYQAHGIGLEPSDDAVALLRNTYKDRENLEFLTGAAHSLPFDNNQFDLVIASSMLHWVDRNRYLQSLGELIRVSKTYLLVMDFFTPNPYKVQYSHDKRFYTYKSDVVPPLLASGMLKIISKKYFVEHMGERHQITEADFLIDGILSYIGRQTCLFLKEDTMKLRSESDFTKKSEKINEIESVSTNLGHNRSTG